MPEPTRRKTAPAWLVGVLCIAAWPSDAAAGSRPPARSKATSEATSPKGDTGRGGGDPDGAADEHGDAPSREIPERTQAPASPECDHRVPLWEHVVESGEHLGGIAGRYGVRRAELLQLNPALTDPDKIRVGQRLRVCPTIAPRLRKSLEVVVRPGDTFGGIALAHGLTIAELVGMQGGKIRDPNRLVAGTRLHVEVDGGVVPEFLPAAPQASRSGTRRVAVGPRSPVSAQLALAGDNVFIKRPHLAWGTQTTIRAIERAVEQYRGRHRGAPAVHIGDISKRGGGALHPHLSHRAGVDVDVGYVLLGADGHRTHFSGVTRQNLDVARTWALVKSFIDTGAVEVIFMDYGLQEVLYEHAKARGVSDEELDELFQYPRGRGRSHGIIRHWRSHVHHFHVRFRG